ncbi:MAG: hypothetical protein ABW061_05195 [Polyangiaceae bacterium]
MTSVGCTFYTSPGQCTNPNPGNHRGQPLQGLWSTTGASQTWKQLPGSVDITNSVAALVFDPEGSSRQWVIGNHATPYLFGTTDDGATFKD